VEVAADLSTSPAASPWTSRSSATPPVGSMTWSCSTPNPATPPPSRPPSKSAPAARSKGPAWTWPSPPGILGGTTPAERAPLRRQRQQTYARKQAAQRATVATGIDLAELRAPVGRSMAAHLRGDASATLRAWKLCKTAGTSHVARLIGVHVTDLHKALAYWGLEVPNLHQPAELVQDPAKAREAFALVEQLGWVKAAREIGVARRTLRAAFAQWGMGEPVHRGPRAPTPLATERAAAEAALELAVLVGTSRAAERLGVNPATLYYAWKRWGLERPTDRAEGARRAQERKLAAARRADRERHPWRRDRSTWQ